MSDLIYISDGHIERQACSLLARPSGRLLPALIFFSACTVASAQEAIKTGPEVSTCANNVANVSWWSQGNYSLVSVQVVAGGIRVLKGVLHSKSGLSRGLGSYRTEVNPCQPGRTCFLEARLNVSRQRSALWIIKAHHLSGEDAGGMHPWGRRASSSRPG